MTLNGILSIRRTLLSRSLPYDTDTEKAEVVPLDELLQIDKLPFKMTKAVMLEVAYMGQMMSSYSLASKELEKKLGYEISTTLVRKVTIFVGQLVYQRDLCIALQTKNNMVDSLDSIMDKRKGILYILIDGAAVNTRVEDRNGSSWRENKLGLSFASISVINRGSTPKNGQKIIKKEYTAFIGSAEEFSKFVYQIALNQGYGRFEDTVILADGATWIRTMCQELFPDAIQILDMYHLIENVYEFAKYCFKEDESKYTTWAKKMIVYIEEGQSDKVVKEIEKLNIKKLPVNVVNLKNYITNNEEKMTYNIFKQKGYYIGSGAIESGNKTVLQKRLKQAGMRWSVDTAQAVLSLRAKVESGLWLEVKQLVMNF